MHWYLETEEGKKKDLDYDEEARKLWVTLGLEPRETRMYEALNDIYKHPVTGGTIYVGGQAACDKLQPLRDHRITHILNCTDSIKCFFEKSASYSYCRRDMGSWWASCDKTDESVASFIKPALGFILDAILKGENVLIHCLAGAHRAGTMGIISLMFFCSLNKVEATKAAQRLRPVINPIGYEASMCYF